jgi:hypothetical protein
MISRNKFVRPAHPIEVYRQFGNRCPKVAGNSGEKVSERRPQLLTLSSPLYCTLPNGNIFFLCPGLQSPFVRVSSPTLASGTASCRTSFPSSLSSQHPWQERNYNQHATSIRVACRHNVPVNWKRKSFPPILLIIPPSHPQLGHANTDPGDRRGV